MRLLIPLVTISAIAFAENFSKTTYNSRETTATPETSEQPAPNASGFNSFSSSLFDEIRFYCFLVIGFVSILCNGINIRVLQKQRTASPYIYMTFLAISDFITGMCIVILAMNERLDRFNDHGWMMKTWYHISVPVIYVRFTLTTYSTFLLNTLSIDRLIAVKFPMHHPIWCTPGRARIVSASLALFCAVYNIHFLLRYQMVWKGEPDSQFPYLSVTKLGQIYIFNTIIMYLKFLLHQMLPLLLMSTTNILTIREIVKGIKFRKSSTNNSGKNRVQCLGVTLGVITVFIVTNCPSAAFTLSTLIGAGLKRGSALHLLELLRWTCCVTNFFFYVILDKRFRDEVINLFSCWSPPKKKQLPSCTAASGTEIRLDGATGQTKQHSRLAAMKEKTCTSDAE
ncbi:hypothetical protein CAPTEDRAFT_204089 [Capitella teleta]|uniref:G-protein coupled receptors family 1 profile domain-containing protein n=1 Tax=Capitella teleta TaxID=283909 RepID=R7V470_CAPTE|nr:hypothetical protein CAPTEDRAFT_204089 [Capitella teleta]|eukprot:ELU13643.1 hypothetical protein CAPTEDRAFT_204089 [Capitella teleta]